MDTYSCGHPASDENTYVRKTGRLAGSRRCRICAIQNQHRLRERRKAGEDTSRPVRTHCRYGHELTYENTMIVRGRRLDGIETSRRCRICEAARRQRQAVYMANYRLVRKYGITTEQRDAMIEAQGGICPICRKRKAIAVDHDHDTGKVRGILCKGCNVAIGVIGDSHETIQRAVAYLAAHDIRS